MTGRMRESVRRGLVREGAWQSWKAAQKVKTNRVNLAAKYSRASNKGRGERSVRLAAEDIF